MADIGEPVVKGFLDNGKLPNCNDSSIDTALAAWNRLSTKLHYSANAGSTLTNGIISTYSLVYTTSYAYIGSVLGANGDIHFVPYNGTVGQKVSTAGVVSTYSILAGGYGGGVLASNGDIHFAPYTSTVGQKVSVNGVVSTYSLIVTGGYIGGVLATNGDIHFIPQTAARGQKVSTAGVVSTYSLVYTGSNAYTGGVLAPNGDIHFMPNMSPRGQKISAAGVVSTYSLVYTASSAFYGGVLDTDGNIHLIPYALVDPSVGQKISTTGVVSTYSFPHASNLTNAWLTPSGDIWFLPGIMGDMVIMRKNGTFTTQTCPYTVNNGYIGGVMDANGNIHLGVQSAAYGQKIATMPARPWTNAIASSPFFNRY
jgi:hypothetical protein